jgi:hypothetical protein
MKSGIVSLAVMKKYEVIIKTDLVDLPKEHELSAALLLAYHFKSDVVFLRPQTDRTPDIEVKGIKWEIKSPKGNGKKTIENNLRKVIIEESPANPKCTRARQTHEYGISCPEDTALSMSLP